MYQRYVIYSNIVYLTTSSKAVGGNSTMVDSSNVLEGQFSDTSKVDNECIDLKRHREIADSVIQWLKER